MKLTPWIVGTGLLLVTLIAIVAVPRSLTAQAGGGESSANMQVSANVIRKCTIAAQPMAFGNYDPVQANYAAPLDAQTTLTVACTKGTAVNIAMDNGTNAQGNARRMTGGGANYLGYQVYKDSSRSEVWGETGNGSLHGGIAPSRDPRQFIVYGRVAGGQDVSEGAFQDTVLVTVQF
jgi:spore coat protein U-like protein